MADTKPGYLPPLVLRNLGDKSYEKRKQAALEIEHLIKELKESSVSTVTPTSTTNNSTITASVSSSVPVIPHSRPVQEAIRGLITTLTRDFAHSTQSNQRKGGLIGLAATAIALMEDTPYYLEYLLPPVLKCFADQESRVRYYACESLYNISKVARGSILLYFNEIFDGLCKLYADSDLDVKNGAQLLDRLIKDLVTESDVFDVDKFIPLLRERIRIRNPFIRQLLVGWITVLDSVPDIDMLEFLPDYLGGLFDMLSDPNKDIRQQAYAALAELLRELTASASASSATTQSLSPTGTVHHHIDLTPMLLILVNHCESRDNFTRLTVLTWMQEFIQLDTGKLLPLVADILGVTLQCISDPEKEIRQKSEKTNDALLKLVQSQHQQQQATSSHPPQLNNLQPILNKVTAELSNKWVSSRLASLRWLNMLIRYYPSQVLQYLQTFFPVLLKTLQDADEAVIRLDIEILARICLGPAGASASTTTALASPSTPSSSASSTASSSSPSAPAPLVGGVLDVHNFELVLHQLIQLFSADRRFLEVRGSLIIRQLSELLDAEAVYRAVAELLLGMGNDQQQQNKTKELQAAASGGAATDGSTPAAEDAAAIDGEILGNVSGMGSQWELASLMVQTMNLILLTSSELFELRGRLKRSLASASGRELFVTLYESWCHNPISTFSFCLLCQAYDLAAALIEHIAELEITVGALMQIDTLVQLIESPIFIHLRLHLLEPTRYPSLIKAMYGLLMLLPQSAAFHSLQARLTAIAPIALTHTHHAAIMAQNSVGNGNAHSPVDNSISTPVKSPLDHPRLLAHFQSIQEVHTKKRQSVFKQQSLLLPRGEPGTVTDDITSKANSTPTRLVAGSGNR